MEATKKRLLLPCTVFNKNNAFNAFLLKPLVRFVHLQECLTRILRYIHTQIVPNMLIPPPLVTFERSDRLQIIHFVSVRVGFSCARFELGLILSRTKFQLAAEITSANP